MSIARFFGIRSKLSTLGFLYLQMDRNREGRRGAGKAKNDKMKKEPSVNTRDHYLKTHRIERRSS